MGSFLVNGPGLFFTERSNAVNSFLSLIYKAQRTIKIWDTVFSEKKDTIFAVRVSRYISTMN